MRNNITCLFPIGIKSALLRMGLLMAVGLQVACGGSTDHNRQEYGEAAIFAGIALTAGIIQQARSDGLQPVNAPPASGCCAFCGACSVPCGDSCVDIGTVCLQPRGCACYGTLSPEGDRSPQRPDSCGSLNNSPEGVEPIHPITISP